MMPWLIIELGDGKIHHNAKGWARFRHEPEELERRLKKQRDNTFSRRRFEEMLVEATERAEAEKDKAARRVLKLAVREAKKIDVETVIDFEPLTLALEAAALATATKETLAAAKRLIELAEAEKAKLDLEQDDEEAVWLLLN